MQGILYFPSIRLPPASWLTRSLLYWDHVGTIVPESWTYHPERLGADTQDLVRRGLVRQVFSHEVGSRAPDVFKDWVAHLSSADLNRRRRRFEAGDRIGIHRDKWVGRDFHQTEAAGLARHGSDGEWYEVESATANEFMAALALSLCDPRSYLYEDTKCTWVPATNDAPAYRALLSGLVKLEPDARAVGEDLILRVKGHLRASRLRTSFLDKALPLPAEGLAVSTIERIRRRFGDRLPACRRHIESLVDKTLTLNDDVLEFRAIDRAVEEVEELTGEAESYLHEAGIRRIRRSPLVRMLKCIPGVSGPASALAETATVLEKAGGVETEPFAYLALARATLRADAAYAKEPFAPALAEAFGQ